MLLASCWIEATNALPSISVLLSDVLTLVWFQEILSHPQIDEEVINWQDPLGWIPLTYAAFYGDYELVKQASGMQRETHMDWKRVSGKEVSSHL